MAPLNSISHSDSDYTNRVLPVLILLFVGSGCAALIYEIVWLQMLQLIVGSTAISLGVLLGTFMGGMCLGSLALPHFISSRWHPLKVYAALELGIAIIGLLILFSITHIEGLYSAFSHGSSGILVRGLIGGACLLPPTFLMGATLPAMARWVETTTRGVSWLGFFYGGNIVGAVCGCLLAGFYLLRVHDMAVATYFAAAVNVTVAALALLLAAVTQYHNPLPDTSSNPEQPAAYARWVYCTIAISGFCALGAEVIWTRLLSLMLGGTVYTFSNILAVFLIGLGIGSSLGASIARTTPSPRVALGICQLLLTIAISWSAYMISQSLPYWPIDPTLSLTPWYTFQLDFARCMWVILPAACLWGASFPFALAAVASQKQDPGHLVARVYTVNTAGAILGALAFSFLIMPQQGSQISQRFLIVMSLVASVIAFVPSLWTPGIVTPSQRLLRSLPIAGIAALLAVILTLNLSPIPWGLIAYGRFMATYGNSLAPGVGSEHKASSPYSEFCLYADEGMNVSVAVSETRSGMGTIRSFHGGGKVQASNQPADMRLQRMLGHLPALVHKDPETVLVVACGAGVTAGSFIPHPGIQRIVICDIEPLVPQNVAPLFAKENYDVVGASNADRVDIVYDDGRHFIRTTDEKFDIITSDPIDPWVKGCAALNTIEYYQMCKERLNPGGVMALWMPIYQSNPETLRSVIATFFQVFPYGILWTNDLKVQNNDLKVQGYDAVLFGQVEPSEIDVDQMIRRLNRPDHQLVKQSLQEVGFPSVHQLLATYAGQSSDMKAWGAGAQINTDRNLRLQYLAGMSLNSYMGQKLLKDILQYYEFPENIFTGTEDNLRTLRQELAAGSRIERESSSDSEN